MKRYRFLAIPLVENDCRQNSFLCCAYKGLDSMLSDHDLDVDKYVHIIKYNCNMNS